MLTDLARHISGRRQERDGVMPGVADASDDEAAAIQQMISEGAPDHLAPAPRQRRQGYVCSGCGALKAAPTARCRNCGRRSRLDDLPAGACGTERRVPRRVFRTYCVACGRSSEGLSAPARPGRCLTCGGTMLVELAPD
jgi:DNA-directed RNA polymerase subunit RPC12/RpoP